MSDRAYRWHHADARSRIFLGAQVPRVPRMRTAGDLQPDAQSRTEGVSHGVELEPDSAGSASSAPDTKINPALGGYRDNQELEQRDAVLTAAGA
jgi:hypothetical protein